MATFSRRTAHDFAPNALTLALAERRARGLPVCDLTESNPTRTSLPYDHARIARALGDTRALKYEPHPLGLASARATVQSLQLAAGFDVSVDRILLTASTSEAYGFLFKLFCDPDDEVLIPRPSYPLFDHLAALEHVHTAFYDLAYDGSWHLDFDSLGRARTARTRAIVLVSPNNPTGSFVKRDELARLAKFGLPLISDEVFSVFSVSGGAQSARRARSVLEIDEVPVFALGGLSKYAALPQMKLAWTCARGPASVLSEAFARLELIADTYLSPNTPVQLALPELLAATAPVRAELNARIARNLATLTAAFAHTAATPLFLEGGWYATLRLPSVLDEATWLLTLLNEDGVLTQPGFFYDFVAGPVLVLSLITDEHELALGVSRIAERVRRVTA